MKMSADKFTVKFTNGFSAFYDGDGTWVLIDGTEEQNIVRVGYLDLMIKRYGLIRKEA